MVLLAYAALGAITGLISALFIHSIYGFEHFFEIVSKADTTCSTPLEC
jgi:H+/Cl- antiporter ClcA